jgi:FAD/FMN-containing dehydrogenase
MQAYAGAAAAPLPFAATSHIAYDALDETAAAELAARVAGCPATLHEGGVSIDGLGGAVGDLAADATAFVHREALATVQYTAVWKQGGGGATADRFVRGLRDAMTPHWGDHAYVNYADASLRDPGPAYFGDGWPRLQQVRRHYDPDGFFTQPD